MISSRTFFLTAVTLASGALVLYLLLPLSSDSEGIGDAIEPATSTLKAPASQVGPETIDNIATRPELSIDKVVQPIRSEDTIAIHGRVVSTSKTGLAEVVIEIESKGFGGEEITSHSATSNQLGEYIFDGLVADRLYQLEIKPSGEYAGYILDSFAAGEADILKEIVLDRIKLVDVDGMIVDTNNNPVADFELGVRNLSVEFPDRTIRSDSSGFFNLKAFPAGELRIATNSSDYYRIKGLKLLPDEYRNLTLVLDRGNYHLSGWVSDANGAPLEEVQVTLKSAFANDGYHSFSYRSRVTDENGAFDFADLGGHRMTLGVYAQGFKTHIQQHDFQSFSDTVEIRLSE